MGKLICFFLILVVCSGLVACSNDSGKHSVTSVDFEVLLSRMTNLATFAEAPLGDSFLESSYDRTGGNQDWAIYTKAEPSGRVTLLSVDGPGYVSRVWTAGMDAESWFFFFDGETEPRIKLTTEELFGGSFPFAAPLAGRSSGGWYSLLPIPFSNGIRVEIEPKTLKASNRNYFHINYTKLDLPSSAVKSFPRELSVVQSNLVVAVNAAQEGKQAEQKALVASCLSGVSAQSVGAGQAVSFWEDQGEGLLETFCIRIDFPNAATAMNQELLRKLRLQFFWDGVDEPSVDVPLGDFFCNPFYFRSFSSMPLGRVDDAFICRFPMPYKKGARCVLLNTSNERVTVSVGAEGRRDDRGGLSRTFHAAWRASNTSGRPLTMMKTSGSGHYVGCFLTAIGQDGTWTILEGDEYLRPDPETKPPQLGTGLEDYFSGAYYYTSLFDLPFHGLIEKGAMRTDQYRFHMLESVGFDKSFEAGIEFGDRNMAKGYMSSVAYWYADKVEAVTLTSSLTTLLNRPVDKFELPGLMAQFFMIERGGLDGDAADRIDFFAERYASQPWCDLLRCRSLGYRERVSGFESVKADYEAMQKSSFPSAVETASNILWLHENSSRALLGVHALGKYRLKLDGVVVAEGEGKGALRVVRLTVPQGAHVWEADLTPTHQGSFFSLCLRTPNADYTSADEWEIVTLKEQPGQKRPETFVGRSVLPNMTIWALEPNAYVHMQSPAMGLNLWSFWDSKPVIQSVTLKKKWELVDQVDIQSTMSEQERSAEELRANAIN